MTDHAFAGHAGPAPGRDIGDATGAIDETALLDVWDQAQAFARPWREIAVLAAVTGVTPEQLARLPIGERDRRLLDLQEQWFGARLDCETLCVSCGERLELAFDVADIRVPEPTRGPDDLAFAVDGRVLTLRLPNSADVATCSQLPNGDVALLARCIEGVAGDEGDGDLVAIAMEARERLANRMLDLDPQAETSLALTCPTCGHGWQQLFDPAGYLLALLDTYAERLLDDVHQLAGAYGWSEADVLALPARRRRRYLELIGA
jgi:hypothetical protein